MMNSVANDILELLPLFYLGDFWAADWLGCIVTNNPGFKALAISGTFCLTYVSRVT